jgi:hypothetical protein
LLSKIEIFKTNPITFLDQIDEIDNKQIWKKHPAEFLLNTDCNDSDEINTKGLNDGIIY